MAATRNKVRRPLARERRLFIAELAESLAEEHSPGEARVEPEAIARAHGITISYNDYGGAFDGLLECRGGRFHVYCSLTGTQERGDGRARFTVAHELAHYFIPEHRQALLSGRAPAHPSFCDRPYPESQVEEEADFFASRLLLPEGRFRRALEEYGRDLDGLRDVARVFGASIEASVRRAVEMPDSFLAMVLFRGNAVYWHRVSPSLEAAGLRRIKVVRANEHPGSATWKASTARTPADGAFRSTGSAHHWFYHVEPGSPRDVILREEAIRNRFYILTLLIGNR